MRLSIVATCMVVNQCTGETECNAPASECGVARVEGCVVETCPDGPWGPVAEDACSDVTETCDGVLGITELDAASLDANDEPMQWTGRVDGDIVEISRSGACGAGCGATDILVLTGQVVPPAADACPIRAAAITMESTPEGETILTVHDVVDLHVDTYDPEGVVSGVWTGSTDSWTFWADLSR